MQPYVDSIQAVVFTALVISIGGGALLALGYWVSK